MRSILAGISAFVWLGALTLTTGCSSYGSYVDTNPDEGLGRVVVYRNGIAFYERRATVEDGVIKLDVPPDKVDDLLKSLTVAEYGTGRPLPVSFPTSGTGDTGAVDMTIQVNDPSVRDVVLTYIGDAPAWKPSYRVVVGDQGVKLQGWAIVDNTSGERWEKVRVGVGSSSALSFKYNLRNVVNVHRQTLHGQTGFAVAPPTGGAVVRKKHDQQQVVASFDARSIPTMDRADGDVAEDDLLADVDAPQREQAIARTEARRRKAKARGRKGRAPRKTTSTATNFGGGLAGLASGAKAQTRPRPVVKPMPTQQVQQLATQLRNSKRQVVIEGYSSKGERNGQWVSSDRANWLRNELIKNGVPPAQVAVDAKGAVAGRSAGVRLVQAPISPENAADLAAEPVGESHFESERTMTVERGTSAMIAMLDDKADGDIVYLYDPVAERGNERFAFKAIRFKNPTDSTLETGPMTVYGEGRFIGEGLTEPIPPRATAVVPFALDRQVIVERADDSVDSIHRLVALDRGVLRTEVKHTRRTTLELTSMLHKPVELFIRHNVMKGWSLTKSPDVYEQIGERHLFKVRLEPGEQTKVVIAETTPLMKTLDLRTRSGVDLVRLYLDGGATDSAFDKPMRALLALYRDMGDTRQKIQHTRERLAEFRTRMIELQTQIASLHDVKGASQLMRHLQAKLKETSARVQKDTIAVVDLKEKLMLNRIRFQDGVAELTLAKSATTPRDKDAKLGG